MQELHPGHDKEVEGVSPLAALIFCGIVIAGIVMLYYAMKWGR